MRVERVRRRKSPAEQRSGSCNVVERDPVRLAVLVTVMLLAVLAGACGSSDSSSSRDPGAPPNAGREDTASATTITWAKGGEVAGLDPQIQSAQVSRDVLLRVYEQLVQVRDDGTIAPQLATSWKRVSPVAYDFRLRRNARFSNGRRMTSADVVASFNRVLDPELGSFWLSQLGMIKSVEAQGPDAVRFTLKEPAGAFVPALAGMGASILPAKELKAGTFDPAKELLGTGPYRVERHLPEESWTLVRNPHYWRQGYPKVAKLVILIVNDPNARLAALRSGRADIATSDDADTPKLLDGTPNVRVVAQSTSDFYVLHLNALGESSKVRDARVRQAIALALDREQIIELALGAAGNPLSSAGTVSELPDACDPPQLTGPDIDGARRLIGEAGADGLEFGIEVTTAYPILSRVSQVIQAQLEEVGLRPSLHAIEVGAWREKVYTKGEFDANLSFHSAFVDNWFGLATWSPSAVGFTKVFAIDDPAFDELLDRSARLEPGESRATLFQRMCELAATQANLIPLATRTMFVAYRTDRVEPALQDFEPNSNTLKNVAEFTGS